MFVWECNVFVRLFMVTRIRESNRFRLLSRTLIWSKLCRIGTNHSLRCHIFVLYGVNYDRLAYFPFYDWFETNPLEDCRSFIACRIWINVGAMLFPGDFSLPERCLFLLFSPTLCFSLALICSSWAVVFISPSLACFAANLFRKTHGQPSWPSLESL